MKLIRLREVMDMTCLAKATIYRMIADGTFPKQVSIGERAVAWVEHEVEDWIFENTNEREV
jgi:prophage regulatory protein